MKKAKEQKSRVKCFSNRRRRSNINKKPPILVETQKWLEVQAHVSYRIHQEKFQQNNLRRINFNNAKNLGIQSSDYSEQLANRNQSITLGKNATVEPHSTTPFPSLNNRNQSNHCLQKMLRKPYT